MNIARDSLSVGGANGTQLFSETTYLSVLCPPVWTSCLAQLAAWSARREVGPSPTADLEMPYVPHVSSQRGHGSPDRSRRSSRPGLLSKRGSLGKCPGPKTRRLVGSLAKRRGSLKIEYFRQPCQCRHVDFASGPATWQYAPRLPGCERLLLRVVCVQALLVLAFPTAVSIVRS